MGEAAITWFEDPPYEFLSNFHPATVRLDGAEYPTVEHAYQAAKTLDLLEREHVRSAPTPAVAKERGGQVAVRPDWNDRKVAVMRDLLAQKFSDPVLRERLAATAPLDLIEGNTWGDRFWGVYDGEGENWLGRLLMEVRDDVHRGRNRPQQGESSCSGRKPQSDQTGPSLPIPPHPPHRTGDAPCCCRSSPPGRSSDSSSASPARTTEHTEGSRQAKPTP